MAAAAGSVDEVAAALVEVLDLNACTFEPFPWDAQLPRIESDRIVMPAEEPAIGPCRLDEGIELPVRWQGLPLGRFVLIPRMRTVGVALAPSAREKAIRLAGEFGAAVVRSWADAPIA